MQGVILSAGRARGLILGDDGGRYSFTPPEYRGSEAPAFGLRVEFEVQGTNAFAIHPVPSAAPGFTAQPPVFQRLDPPAGAPGVPVVQSEPDPPPSGVRSFGQLAFSWRELGTRWRLWVLAASAVLVVILVIVGAFALGLFGASGPPVGKEIARHTHEGRTYNLVEYGKELAIFTESGEPVVSREVAEDVLHSYSWRQVIGEFDVEKLVAVSQKVQRLDESVSGVRDLSNRVVSIFDSLEELEARVPILGSISAMDVVRDSFPAVGDAEELIRSLNSELNDLGSNASTLRAATSRISSADLSSVSGEEMETLFTDALEAVQGLESTSDAVDGFLSDVRELVRGLAGALRAGSDTPLIGNALADFARDVDSFESRLSGLAEALAILESELEELGQDFEKAMESADEILRADIKRWLPEPYDAQWPPTDPERSSPATGSQPTAQPRQATEPTMVALRDDGGSKTDEPADYQRAYQAA